MFTEGEFLRLVKYAAKAPSSHNTQPWVFKKGPDSILIRPDLSRQLPVVDPDNHALYISLGCAVENLLIASQQFGYDTRPVYSQGENGMEVSIRIGEVNGVKKPELFMFIYNRQVTKTAYSSIPLSKVVLAELMDIPMGPGVHLQLIEKGPESEKLLPLVIEGSNLQFGNNAFVDELVAWIRFSEKEAMRRADGISNASMGFPSAGRALGGFIMKNLVSAKSEAKRWEKLMNYSGGFALFSVSENTPKNWINLGRSFQRFGLETTSLGLKHAHMNMPLEEISVRERVIETFALGDKHPLLLLRLGYAKPAPYSFRRNLHEMIVKE